MARGTGFASCRLRTQSRQRLAACTRWNVSATGPPPLPRSKLPAMAQTPERKEARGTPFAASRIRYRYAPRAVNHLLAWRLPARMGRDKDGADLRLRAASGRLGSSVCMKSCTETHCPWLTGFIFPASRDVRSLDAAFAAILACHAPPTVSTELLAERLPWFQAHMAGAAESSRLLSLPDGKEIEKVHGTAPSSVADSLLLRRGAGPAPVPVQ